MTQPEHEPRSKAKQLRDPDGNWITRMCEEKLARGGGPDYEAAQEALARLDARIAERGPMDFGGEEADAIVDAMGLRKNIARDWPVVPWSYWEARGAGPYRH